MKQSHKHNDRCDVVVEVVFMIERISLWSVCYLWLHFSDVFWLTSARYIHHLYVISLSQVFSPEDRECLSIYHVSPAHGGLKPNCTTRLDGTYPEDHGRPDLYYACRNQQVIGMARCSDGMVFDAKFSFCRLPYLWGSKLKSSQSIYSNNTCRSSLLFNFELNKIKVI